MIDLKELENIVKSIDINLSEDDVFDILQIRKRWPLEYFWGQKSVEIIDNYGKPRVSNFFKQDGFLNYEEWKTYYDLGFTSIISNVLDLTKELRLLQKKLIERTGMVINANFYFSKPGQLPSFNKHMHNYAVIVKQIYGESEWIVEDKQFILNEKDTCIIPKNGLHQVISKKNKKLSLTINIE